MKVQIGKNLKVNMLKYVKSAVRRFLEQKVSIHIKMENVQYVNMNVNMMKQNG